MARKLNQKLKPAKARAGRGKRPSTRKRKASEVTPFKGKRFTLNAPDAVVPMLLARVAECPYRSNSDYLLALVVYDCWSRRLHRYTPALMKQPPAVRDSALAKIVEQFHKGEQRSGDPSYFDDLFKRIVDAELRRLGVAPL